MPDGAPLDAYGHDCSTTGNGKRQPPASCSLCIAQGPDYITSLALLVGGCIMHE